MNYALKGIKSDNFIDFIWSDHREVISNKIASPSDLLVIELYIKNQNSMNANDVHNYCNQNYISRFLVSHTSEKIQILSLMLAI